MARTYREDDVDGNTHTPIEYLARKGEGKMDAEDERNVIRRAIADSIQYVDEELSPERAKATEYYNGKPFGNEEEGRSQAVMTEVRDGIAGIIPGLVRVLHGPDHTVEYMPRRAEGVPGAEQATDYARYIYEEDNPGFLITHSTLKDGLLKKLGVVKWGMDEIEESTTTPYRGVTREELASLVSADNTRLKITKVNKDGTYDAEITVAEDRGRIWVEPIPPDDFFWNREARSIDDAILVGHRTRRTRGQLLAMGITEKDLDEHAGSGNDADAALRNSEEEIARRTSATSGFSDDVDMGDENDKYVYCEAYMMMDVAGTGKAELRKISTIGSQYYAVKNEPAPEKPFAMFSPDPEPHAMLGTSWFDRLKDLQLIDSQLLRGMLDSLSISLFPRTIYVDGQANVKDILNTAIGAPMRERVPGAIRSYEQPFTGEKVMPIMGFMQDVMERRTGRAKGALSLDSDALQSTGKEAAGAAIQASQAQEELLVRIYAEQVMKPMFRGILKLATRPESKARIVRLRGQYVNVDPLSWDVNMDVTVNVTLGSMNTEKKIGVLSAVVADQTMILQQFGPTNPMVTVPMLRNAKARILALQGIKNVDDYYKPIPPDWQPPAPPAPQPTAEELWIKAEKEMAHQATMKELAIKADELRLRESESDRKFRLEMRKIEADMITKKYVADTTAKTAADATAIDREIAETELTIDAHSRVIDQGLAAHDQSHDQQLEVADHEHTVDMGTRAADLADTTATAGAEGV